MQITWKLTNENPYLFKQAAAWNGVRVHRARVLPGRMLEQVNASHELNINLGGRLTTEKLSANGRRVRTKGAAGNLCLTPAGQPIGAFWDGTLDNMGISFSPEFVERTAAENHFNSKFEFAEIYKKEDSLIQHVGLALLAEAKSETPAGKLYAESLIQTLTLHLLKNYSTAPLKSETAQGGLSGYKLRRATEYINANLEANLSLGEIAAVADLSQFHFARAFRASTGFTPHQYLMRQRIERAKELLAKNDLPIIEISLQTGFKNQSHFTTLFHKYTKFTPRLWRELKIA